jgi:hypothetical protein
MAMATVPIRSVSLCVEASELAALTASPSNDYRNLIHCTRACRQKPTRYLGADFVTSLTTTSRYGPLLATKSEGRLLAIVGFTFNLGAGRLQTSTFRLRVNQRNLLAAAMELRGWV